MPEEPSDSSPSKASLPEQPSPGIERIIWVLETMRKRTDMYVGDVTIEAVRCFLRGFETGVKATGIHVPGALRLKVLKARGWRDSATGPVPQMEAQGLSEVEIVQEMITLEIETWKAVQRQLAQESELRGSRKSEHGIRKNRS